MDKNLCQNLLRPQKSLKISIQLNQGLRQRQVSVLYKRDIKIDRLPGPQIFVYFPGRSFLVFWGLFILSFRFFLLQFWKGFPLLYKMYIFFEGRDFSLFMSSLIFKSFIKFVQIFFLHLVFLGSGFS